ncbi:MAG: hypothetical protein AB1467_00990 [Candidatus Diapherotrites archaeon]
MALIKKGHWKSIAMTLIWFLVFAALVYTKSIYEMAAVFFFGWLFSLVILNKSIKNLE